MEKENGKKNVKKKYKLNIPLRLFETTQEILKIITWTDELQRKNVSRSYKNLNLRETTKKQQVGKGERAKCIEKLLLTQLSNEGHLGNFKIAVNGVNDFGTDCPIHKLIDLRWIMTKRWWPIWNLPKKKTKRKGREEESWPT